jgi:hypothetical protein
MKKQFPTRPTRSGQTLADFSAAAFPLCASGMAKLKPQTLNASRAILPGGSDQINKNKTP